MSINFSKKNKVLVLVATLLAIISVAIIIVIWAMYNAAVLHEKERLFNSVRAHAIFIDTIAKSEQRHNSKSSKEDLLAATLSEVRNGYKKLSSFGRTGEYVIAMLKEEKIQFVFSNRQKEWGLPQPVPFRNSKLAEPMRRALLGKEGIIVAGDYLDRTVIAAYEPLIALKPLKLGLVVKRHIQEIRDPFASITLIAITIGIVLVILGTIVIIRTVNPMIVDLSTQAQDLEQQKELINGIIETANDAIVVIDERGIIQRCNIATTRMFGYRQGELVKQNVSMLMPSSVEKEHDGYLSAYQKTGEKKIIGIGRELVAKHRDGKEFPIFLLVNDIQLENKKFFAGYIRDITEDKKSLEQIQKANEQLESQMALNKQQVWTMKGLSGLENTIRNEKDKSKAAKNVCSYLTKYLDAQIATFYLVENGKLHLTGSYAFSKRKSLGDIIEFGEGFVGQAAIEKELISITDIPPDYTRINSSIGYTVPTDIVVLPFIYDNEVIGCIELGALKELSDVKLHFLKLISSPLAINFHSLKEQRKTRELLQQTQNQAEKLQQQQQKLKNANEELAQQAEELQVSQIELKAQSDHLQQANIELEEKTEALESQKAEVEEKNKSIKTAQIAVEKKAEELKMASKYKSEFLANMSHELRTPLNSLLILSKLLLDNDEKNLTASQIESARAIYSGGQDLVHIINDILDLSKVEAGKLEIYIEEVKLATIIDKLKQQFTPVATKKGIQFHCETAKELGATLATDLKRLEQILKNLLANAFKFTAAGSVTLKIHAADASMRFTDNNLLHKKVVAFSVIDTGIGIAPKKQEAIFEAFQQADGSTNRVYGGTGLGLAISKELARLLGGEIHLKSSEGKGSEFTLYLPQKQQTKVAAKKLESKVVENKAVELETVPVVALEQPVADDRQQIAKGDKSILIIENDRVFAETLIKLSRKKGYKCLVAVDGASGLQLALTYNPSGIVLDLGLPDIDGSKLLEQFKFDLRTRHIPVHIISAQDKSLALLKKGAIGCLVKPASAEDINTIFSKFNQISDNRIRELLLVEDDKNSCTAIAKLIGNKEVNIATAGSGNDAIQQLKTKRFDCVILDLNLPDMTGFELLKKLHDIKLQVPPVIIYTGKELNEEEYLELKKYTNTIVVKGADSPERLLQETTLFLHSVEARLPHHQRQVIQTLHDPQQLLENRKILLVDDDIRNVFAMCAALEKYGLEVITVENGQKALEKLESEADIELVIMDIMMPIMDGYEAMRRIRKQQQFVKLPIIALTAKAMKEDQDLCIEAGANDYMTKPVDIDKLLAMIRMWLFR